MNRYEQIKSMSLEDMAYLLCDLFDMLPCEQCPAFAFCELGEKGFKGWLKEETND